MKLGPRLHPAERARLACTWLATSRFDANQSTPSQSDPHVGRLMPAFTYRCPNTGCRVQGYVAEDVSDPETYEPVLCVMCQRFIL